MIIRDENTALIRYFHRMSENAPLQTPKAQSCPVLSRATFVNHFTLRTAPAAMLFFTLSLSFGLAGLSFNAYGAEDLQGEPTALALSLIHI